MRLATLVMVLVACKGGGETTDKQPPPAPPAPPPKPAYVFAPASDAVLRLDQLPTRHVVWIDHAGALSYARVPTSWDGRLPAQRTAARDLGALAATLKADEASEPAPEAFIDFPMDAPEEPDPGMALGRAPAVMAERDTHHRAPLVLAPPDIPATVVIGVLATIGGRLGVTLPGNRFGGLRYLFESAVASDDDATFWYEAHVGTDRIEMLELTANARTPTEGGNVRTQLAPFVTDKGFDLLLARDVRFERLVEILLAVDDLGVTKHLGLGASPGPIENRKQQALDVRNQGAYLSATAVLALGELQLNGDLAKPLVRGVVGAKAAELLACYDAGLAKNAKLRGLVESQFFVTPKGVVATASAIGVDRAVASCISAVIKKLAFPPPRGGGGAQVNYPFRFRPRET